MSELDPTFNDNQIALHFVEGTVNKQVPFAFADGGAAVDLSVYSSIVMNVRRCDGTSFSLTAVVDDAPNGLAHFTFLAGQLIVGIHEADIVFSTSDGGVDLFPPDAPILIKVRSKS